MEKRKIDLNTINIPKSHALFDYYIKDILELFVCQVSLTLYSLIHVTRDPFRGFSCTRYFKEIAEFDGKTTQANILRSLHQFNQNNQLSQVFMITIRYFWKTKCTSRCIFFQVMKIRLRLKMQKIIVLCGFNARTMDKIHFRFFFWNQYSHGWNFITKNVSRNH